MISKKPFTSLLTDTLESHDLLIRISISESLARPCSLRIVTPATLKKIPHRTQVVDIDAATLMTRSTRPTRKANEVQCTRHMTSKDCYKFLFISRTIIQWNGIAATGDLNQYKSDLKSHDLTLSGPSYNY